MPRTLSPQIRSAVTAPYTGLVALWLVTIDHAGLDAPLRFVQNDEDVTSGDETYTALRMDIELPDSKDSGIASARLALDNTDQHLTETMRSLPAGLTVTFTLARSTNLAASPPQFTAEFSLLPMTAAAVEYDAVSAVLSLTYEPLLDQRYPPDQFTPAEFPGMF